MTRNAAYEHFVISDFPANRGAPHFCHPALNLAAGVLLLQVGPLAAPHRRRPRPDCRPGLSRTIRAAPPSLCSTPSRCVPLLRASGTRRRVSLAPQPRRNMLDPLSLTLAPSVPQGSRSKFVSGGGITQGRSVRRWSAAAAPTRQSEQLRRLTSSTVTSFAMIPRPG